MENNICEYCKKKFSTKSSLKNHQKTAKFCLENRQEKNDQFKCTYCCKILCTKFRLEDHLKICKDKQTQLGDLRIIEIEKQYQNLLQQNEQKYSEKLQEKNEYILELKDSIQRLQYQIKELAQSAIEKPNNLNNILNQDQRQTNNNNNNNSIKNIDNRTINMIPFNLTPESFREALENNFSEAYLLKGQKGVAEFMLENILITGEQTNKKYLLKCTDPSRKVFISLDEKGNIIKDVNADNLTKMISGPVKEVSHRIYQQIQDRYFQVYENTSNELEEDDDESKTLNLENERLDYATNKVVEISKLKNNNTEFVKGLIPPLSI